MLFKSLIISELFACLMESVMKLRDMSNSLSNLRANTLKMESKVKICFAVFFFCILMNYSLGFWYGAKLVSEQTINSSSNQPYSVADVIIIFFTLYMSNLSLSGLPESITSFNICRVSMKRVCYMINKRAKS